MDLIIKLLLSLLIVNFLLVIAQKNDQEINVNRFTEEGRTRNNNSNRVNRLHSTMMSGLVTFILGHMLTMFGVLTVLSGKGLLVGLISAVFAGSYMMSRIHSIPNFVAPVYPAVVSPAYPALVAPSFPTGVISQQAYGEVLHHQSYPYEEYH